MKFYFDGCSYTAGHDQDSLLYRWPTIINTYSNPDNGYRNSLEDTGDQFLSYPYIDYSSIARSNDAIFCSFISNFDKIKKNKTKVFLYFSHSERYFREYKINSYRTTPFKFGYEKVNPGASGGSFLSWIGGTIKTLTFIKSITQLCEDNNIELVIVTQDNYRWFEYLSTLDSDVKKLFDSINYKKYIFNWPSPELINYVALTKDPDTVEPIEHLELWGTTGFALCLSKAFGPGDEWVSRDNKHFKREGHIFLGNALKEFMDDNSKNLSYYLDDLNVKDKRFFYDRNIWIEQYFYRRKHNHHIEGSLKQHFRSLLKDIKMNSDFIYEE